MRRPSYDAFIVAVFNLNAETMHDTRRRYWHGPVSPSLFIFCVAVASKFLSICSSRGLLTFKKEACRARALRIAVLLLPLSCLELEHVPLSLFLSSLGRSFALRLSPSDLTMD